MTNWLFVFYMHFTYIYKQPQQQTLYPREVKWLTRGQGLPQLPSSQSHIPGSLLGGHLLQGVLSPYLLHPASLPLQPLGPAPSPAAPHVPRPGLQLAFHTQTQGLGAGAPPGGGLGTSATSGIHYPRWLRSGLLCLPLTYLPG